MISERAEGTLLMHCMPFCVFGGFVARLSSRLLPTARACFLSVAVFCFSWGMCKVWREGFFPNPVNAKPLPLLLHAMLVPTFADGASQLERGTPQ